ncbi:MAG: hypothetical protein ACI4OS_02025 [Akkermansia sp.]
MKENESAKARLLVLVCSCLGYHDRSVRAVNAAGSKAKREACRKTWLANIPEGVTYAFFVGGQQPEGEPDVWALDAPDTYNGLPEKVRAAFARALTVPGWSYLFKCDDDSFIHLPRLKELVEAQDGKRRIVSWHGRVQPWSSHGGAGYLLTRELVECIVADSRLQLRGAEDREIHFSAVRAGAEVLFDEQFCPNKSMVPAVDNRQISAHWCTPDDMRAIFADDLYREVPTWQKAQSSRKIPAALPRRGQEIKFSESPMADGLLIPTGTRRIVIFSNIHFDPRALPLLPGDHCIHINRARQYYKIADIAGVTHACVVRKGADKSSGRVRWYDPPATEGFLQVLHIADSPMRQRRAWWREYCRCNPGKGPTSGFICWQLAREAAPALPVVLAGFAPGENFGTPIWRGHAWNYEAKLYALARAHIVRPDAARMGGNLPSVRYLVMVCSGMQHKTRRDAVRATWARGVPQGVAVHFYSGAQDAPPAEDADSPDMVRLSGISHTQGDLPAAHIAMMRWALQHYDFRYLFRCDDDTYTALDRLANYTPAKGAAMIGNPDPIRRAVALSGGAGYIIPREWVERLVFNPGPAPWKYDDVYISHEIQRLGGVLAPDRRFYHPHDKVPAPGNRQITAHWCSPENMEQIAQGLQQ